MTDDGEHRGPWFHVTSSLNRDSIRRHGLDPARMGAAPGIAGSSRPEADGVFVARGEDEVDWFVEMNNTGGPVDVWRVEGVEPAALLDNGSGFVYRPGTVPAADVVLVRTDIPPREDRYAWPRQPPADPAPKGDTPWASTPAVRAAKVTAGSQPAGPVARRRRVHTVVL